MADENNQQEQKTELTPEQKTALETGGRTASDAMKPDPAKPDKEGLDETHEDPKDKKPDPTKEEKPKNEENTDPEKNDDGSWKDEYVKIDNVHASAAIDLLKEANVSPVEANDMFKEAIETGDLNKVDWARLEKKLGPAKAALVKAGVTAYYDNEYKHQAATVKLGHDMFGGEENWDIVRKHFQAAEKKDPVLKTKLDQMRAALNAGGWQAEVALKELKSMYETAPNTKGLKNKQIERGDSTARGDQQYISKEDYARELQTAERERWPEGKINELRNRRRYSIQKDMQS